MTDSQKNTRSELVRRWVGRAVRSDSQTIDIAPANRIEDIYYGEESGEWVAWAGFHVREASPDLLEVRLSALAQPSKGHGRLSRGRYEATVGGRR